MSLINKLEILSSIWFDISLRVVLGITFVQLEKSEPFTRKIHEEELWLYKNPITDSYVPTTVLWLLVFTTPMMVILSMFLLHKDKIDFYQAVLCITLALGLNGLFTDIIKNIVGRPRPDFFWRCFPDGKMNSDFACTGNPISIRDGKKSFPSGHSSFAFTSFGFVALYTAGKLHTFGSRGKSQSWKLCLFFFPIIIALVIALSRTCDYHHHWQDILVGGMIGSCLTYLCYRHYYPSLDSQVSHKPYAELIPRLEKEKSSKGENVKWI